MGGENLRKGGRQVGPLKTALVQQPVSTAALGGTRDFPVVEHDIEGDRGLETFLATAGRGDAQGGGATALDQGVGQDLVDAVVTFLDPGLEKRIFAGHHQAVSPVLAVVDDAPPGPSADMWQIPDHGGHLAPLLEVAVGDRRSGPLINPEHGCFRRAKQGFIPSHVGGGMTRDRIHPERELLKEWFQSQDLIANPG